MEWDTCIGHGEDARSLINLCQPDRRKGDAAEKREDAGAGTVHSCTWTMDRHGMVAFRRTDRGLVGWVFSDGIYLFGFKFWT